MSASPHLQIAAGLDLAEDLNERLEIVPCPKSGAGWNRLRVTRAPVDSAIPNRDEPLDWDELRKRLEFLAARMLGDREAAADAVQETMLRLLTLDRGSRLPEANRVGAFGYGILRHVVVDLQRAAGRETVGDAPELSSTYPDALEQLITDEEAERVHRALRRLSRGDRQLLERCFIDGERVGSIARNLGEPEGRVRVRKLRALQRLRDLLEG